MQLTVQGQQISVGENLREYVEEKIEDINQKYFNHANHATITFSKEGHSHPLVKAHISITVGKNIMVIADDEESDPYAAFDYAATKVAKQLRRYKTRLRDHHERTEQVPEAEIQKAQDYVISANESTDNEEEKSAVPEGDDPVVIAEMTTNIETMSVSEAVMRLDLAHQNALMFRNAKTNELNMVYRRTDGNIGWVDPETAGVANTAQLSVVGKA